MCLHILAFVASLLSMDDTQPFHLHFALLRPVQCAVSTLLSVVGGMVITGFQQISTQNCGAI
jgi:hypothetical protein